MPIGNVQNGSVMPKCKLDEKQSIAFFTLLNPFTEARSKLVKRRKITFYEVMTFFTVFSPIIDKLSWFLSCETPRNRHHDPVILG